MNLNPVDVQGMLNCLNAFTADGGRQFAIAVSAELTLLVSSGPGGAFGFQPVKTVVIVAPCSAKETGDGNDDPISVPADDVTPQAPALADDPAPALADDVTPQAPTSADVAPTDLEAPTQEPTPTPEV